MRQRRAGKGFTLLELLMVVVIIGILAAIGLPQYFKTIEKMRMAEALSVLASIRSSEARLYAETTSAPGGSTYAGPINVLDFDPSPAGAMTGVPAFGYSVPAGTANATDFIAIATRLAAPVIPPGSGCVAGYTIRICANGVIRGRACQITGVGTCTAAGD